MRHQVEKGTFSYENKERTKREKLVRTKWAFHRFGALTVMTPVAPAKNGIIPRVEKSHFLGVSLSFLHSLESSEGFQYGLFGCSILVHVRFDCIGLQEWMDEKMVLLLISLALVVMALQCSA